MGVIQFSKDRLSTEVSLSFDEFPRRACSLTQPESSKEPGCWWEKQQ